MTATQPVHASYYGRPVIKPPVWKPEIPWYFFTGGLTGASAALSLAADWAGERELARRTRMIASIAGTASPVLLTRELGRPERFMNMLRVFKVTSPMSVGSWIVLAAGAANAVAQASATFGIAPRAGRAARVVAAAAGLPMATYTAVLVANTAIPVWQGARRELPFVFAGSAAASAGAAAAVATPVRHARAARHLTVVGAALEEGATVAMRRRLGDLGEPYARGAAGRYAQGARVLTPAGALLVAAGGRRSRFLAAVGGLAVLAGSVLQRWSVFAAGFDSARDPRFTVGPQRTRLAERDGAR